MGGGEGFLARNIAAFTGTVESVIAAEDTCRAPGMLQRLDPRVKILTFVIFIASTGLMRTAAALGIILFIVLILAILSKINLLYFLKRVGLFIPLFTLVISIPALFITPGNPLLDIAGRVVITRQGAVTAGMLFLRVTDSLSFGVLLILTTSWTGILSALRWLRLPAVVVDILAMTYRYIILLLRSVNNMFLARRSRSIGSFSAKENRRWLAAALSATMAKSQYLGEEVYSAMVSRGYRGEIITATCFKITRRDSWWIVFTLIATAFLFWSNYLWT
jgi:cobalt/nickel transport system permease protein